MVARRKEQTLIRSSAEWLVGPVAGLGETSPRKSKERSKGGVSCRSSKLFARRSTRAYFDDPPPNLIGPTFAEDLIALIQEAEASPAYRVVVFESAVANFFSAHVDLTRAPQLLEVIQQFLPGEFLGMLYRRLSTAPVVTIAKVAGRVRGAGNEFILACDMCFASHERAVFGQMEAGLGLLPGAGGVQHLTRLLGRQRAMEVVLSGDDYSGEI